LSKKKGGGGITSTAGGFELQPKNPPGHRKKSKTGGGKSPNQDGCQPIKKKSIYTGKPRRGFTDKCGNKRSSSGTAKVAGGEEARGVGEKSVRGGPQAGGSAGGPAEDKKPIPPPNGTARKASNSYPARKGVRTGAPSPAGTGLPNPNLQPTFREGAIISPIDGGSRAGTISSGRLQEATASTYRRNKKKTGGEERKMGTVP